jgi:hypothetical protein
VLSLVNGDVNKNVLMTIFIMFRQQG